MAFATNAPADAASDENFPDLLTQFDPLIKRAARRASYYLNGTANNAEDLAQDVRCHMIAVLRKDPAADPVLIRKMITNALRSRIRSEKRRLQLASVDACELDERLPELHDRGSGDVAVVMTVSLWLSTLPARLRAIFEALYRLGYTQREASGTLHLSQPRLSQLHRELIQRGQVDLSVFAA